MPRHHHAAGLQFGRLLAPLAGDDFPCHLDAATDGKLQDLRFVVGQRLVSDGLDVDRTALIDGVIEYRYCDAQ